MEFLAASTAFWVTMGVHALIMFIAGMKRRGQLADLSEVSLCGDTFRRAGSEPNSNECWKLSELMGIAAKPCAPLPVSNIELSIIARARIVFSPVLQILAISLLPLGLLAIATKLAANYGYLAPETKPAVVTELMLSACVACWVIYLIAKMASKIPDILCAFHPSYANKLPLLVLLDLVPNVFRK